MLTKIGKFLLHIFYAFCIFCLANSVVLVKMMGNAVYLCLVIPLFIFINIMPSFFHRKLHLKRIRTCANGCELLKLFLLSTAATVVFTLIGWFGKLSVGSLIEEPVLWIFDVLVAVVAEAVIFWSGMIRIYVASVQLGIRWRVIGAICGMIPVVHLIVLGILIHKVQEEIRVEEEKCCINETRVKSQVCHTRYPLLFVHGVFFRDYRYLNYWGRIPKELEKNGATVFYGNHQSAASVADSGKEITERIRQIVAETGCEKVNIIAHSKGGLDSRYAISMCGAEPYVASLTTINTPHRGCEFADYLLSKIPKKQQDAVANTYNAALRKFGDTKPDFLSAVYDLTAESCKEMNEQVKDAPGVFYQSVGSKLNVASSGRVPLNFTYQLVNYFDGANDGLVGEKSFPWGSEYRFLTVNGNRGISHGDMIDLNRENFDGFDVREFYVNLVEQLKNRGF